MATRERRRREVDRVDESDAFSANFASARRAYAHLEGRGYRLTKHVNWLPPANIAAPGALDLEAAMLLTHAADYGGIIVLRACPFCGGRANAFSPIGIECLDCGATAQDIEAWQRRVGR